MSRDYCVAVPHDATGLSTICGCGISRLYSLTVLETIRTAFNMGINSFQFQNYFNVVKVKHI